MITKWFKIDIQDDQENKTRATPSSKTISLWFCEISWISVFPWSKEIPIMINNRNLISNEIVFRIQWRSNLYQMLSGLPSRLIQTFNSLWPSHAIWWYRSESTLPQVMAWYRQVPCHYLNQCWLPISVDLWYSRESHFTASAPATKKILPYHFQGSIVFSGLPTRSLPTF